MRTAVGGGCYIIPESFACISVHRLPSSAAKFFLRDAANRHERKCWRACMPRMCQAFPPWNQARINRSKPLRRGTSEESPCRKSFGYRIRLGAGADRSAAARFPAVQLLAAEAVDTPRSAAGDENVQEHETVKHRGVTTT